MELVKKLEEGHCLVASCQGWPGLFHAVMHVPQQRRQPPDPPAASADVSLVGWVLEGGLLGTANEKDIQQAFRRMLVGI